MNLLDMGALAQSEALANRSLSAVELMEATLDRIEAVNGRVNAIVSMVARDVLLDQARAADAGRRRGWLHGIPIAIKDLSDAKGLPTSKGSPLFAGSIAENDSLFVARIKAAGAIVIGKTNTPEFGLGSHTFNPVHGATRVGYDGQPSQPGWLEQRLRHAPQLGHRACRTRGGYVSASARDVGADGPKPARFGGIARHHDRSGPLPAVGTDPISKFACVELHASPAETGLVGGLERSVPGR